MFCPACTSEYREGYVRCQSCDQDLVEESPDVPLLKVFETTDYARGDAYKSVLDAARIEYIFETAGVQELYGLRNHSVEFYVQVDAAGEARALGRALDRNRTETHDYAAFRKACFLLGAFWGRSRLGRFMTRGAFHH